MMELKLSEEGKKEFEKIKKKVDEDFKELWDSLDEYLKGTGYTHDDVCGSFPYLYVIDKKTKERIWLYEKYSPKRKKESEKINCPACKSKMEIEDSKNKEIIYLCKKCGHKSVILKRGNK